MDYKRLVSGWHLTFTYLQLFHSFWLSKQHTFWLCICMVFRRGTLYG